MSTNPVYGFQGQLGIDSANPVTKRFDFESSTIGVAEQLPDTNGLRGTRSRSVERVVTGIRHVGGQVKLRPTAVELSRILQFIMGGTPSGSPTVTYPLADALPTGWYVTVDKVAKVATYNGATLDRCTIRGSQGEPIEIDLDIVAFDETIANSGTFPALSLDLANTPFTFQQLSLSLSGTTYVCKEVEIVIDNVIDKERFWNSATLTAAIAMDRHITFRTTLAAGDAWALYGVGSGGMSAVATWTNGGAVLTLTAGKAVFPREPVAVDRGEVLIPMPGIFYKSGSTLELVTTLNPGP